MRLGLSLRAKLVIASIIVLLPVLALLLFNFQSNLQQREEVIVSNQSLTAEAVAQQVNQAFDAAIGIGWAVASTPLVQSMDPTLLDPYLLTVQKRNSTYDGVNVFNAQGINTGWGTPSVPAEPRLDISDRDYFQKTMATNSPTVSKVLLLLRQNVVGVVAAVPIPGQNGQPIGVVTVVMRTDSLAARYQQVSAQPGQAIFLVDPTGRLAFHTARPNLPFAQSDVFATFPPIQQALAGQPTEVDDFQSPLLGDSRMGAFVPTPAYGWVVGVTISRDVALAPVQSALREQLVAFGGILIFSLALALLLAQYLARPVRQLEDQARTLGQGDLSRRTDIRTGDELEHLGTAFNEMAAQMEERQAEILRLRRQAEERAGQLAAVIASMKDAVFVVDPQGRTVDANPAALQLIGVQGVADLDRPLGDYMGFVDADVQDEQGPARGGSPVDRLLGGEGFANFTMRLHRPDGADRLVTLSGAPVRDEAGHISQLVIVARDVTEERRRAQETQALAQIARALVGEMELKG
ncbi:MAG: cache domain-containing protein, partial [Chloroflexota bacterium]